MMISPSRHFRKVSTRLLSSLQQQQQQQLYHTRCFRSFFSTQAALAEPPAETALNGEEAPNGSKKKSALDDNLRPSEVVQELDRYIVGQADAKRAVAIAMRNRWRRKLLPDELRKEVTPRNVLLIGPTGCGKTEVARRMAILSDAPFLKVEATKFTEVGYHGRDVDQIIRDLVDVALILIKQKYTKEFQKTAQHLAEQRILDALTGPSADARGRESFLDLLQSGGLDDQTISVEVPVESSSSSDMTAVTELWSKLSNKSGSPMQQGGSSSNTKTERKKLKIPEARQVLQELELGKLMNNVDIKKEAIYAVENTGIVFLDEIDKICTNARDSRSTDASAEGVQRDLLPLIEGTTISTKHGNVNTDFILFIASGAFHDVKPSSMLPELQGRLPIRVELKALTEHDLYRILTEPVANLIRQQIALIKTEGVELRFDDDAIREIAKMAFELNRMVENIGARRLHTVMERIMEEFSFQAAELDEGSVLTVDIALVQDRLKDVAKKPDLAKYIL
jgi:ATP-dependent HslUV protease ATP-binding subunit HslU